MEVFEEKTRVKRQSSSSSGRIRKNSKVGYILTMAGIILVTSALLVIIHFTREYTNTQEISDVNEETAEKLERRACEVPFCNTKDCVFIAASMLESMNTKADPCTDFYEYACGGYRRAKAIPYPSDHYSPAKEAQEELLLDIRKMLEKVHSDNEGSALGKIKRLYNSCLNATLRDENENRTLSFWLSDLKLVPPNYAIGKEFEFEPSTQWTQLIANLEQYQIHTLFKPRFVSTQHDAAPEKLEVDCLIPSLNPQAYHNSTDDELTFQLVMYKESMRAALDLLHMDRTTRNQFIEDVMKIETDIARTVASNEPGLHPYLTGEYKQQLREIWRPVVGDAVQDMEVVSTCKYDLQDILTVLNHAPNVNVVKYVLWKMLMQTMQYMGTEFRNLHIHYMTKLPDLDYAYESKWRECVDVIRTELGLVATKALFDQGYLQKDTIDVVNAEFTDLKRNIALLFSSLIQDVDQTFAGKFLDKLKNMKLETGYIENLNQEGLLDSLFSEMEISDEYFSNILEMKRFKARRKFLRLWYQGNTDVASQISLDPSPLGSSSSYDYITNTARVDLGLLRSPVFVHSDEIPRYLSYGFSSILAHEMARAFDNTGSHYDGEGQHFEKLFWPSSIEQKYDDFLRCLVDQIRRLNIKSAAEINDTRVINNIMADMGSFFIPYEGLKTYLKSHMNEKPLPGIHLNKKQTFYVQTAQIFCELRNKASSDPASKFLLPPKSRVNIAISNMEDFGRVFTCPETSAMNLENKCNLLNFLPDDH